MKIPDETVAEKITASLLENGLITNDDAKKLSGKLARGEVKDSEWLMLMRMGMQSQSKAKEVDAR
jgi:hypothetical protein